MSILNNIADLLAPVLEQTGRRVYSSLSEASFLTYAYWDIFPENFDETNKTKVELRVLFHEGDLFAEDQTYFVEAEGLAEEGTPRLFAEIRITGKPLDPPMYVVLECDFIRWTAL